MYLSYREKIFNDFIVKSSDIMKRIADVLVDHQAGLNEINKSLTFLYIWCIVISLLIVFIMIRGRK